MKKTLLLSAIAFVAIFGLNAQVTKVWNLGGDPGIESTAPAFAVSSGIGTGDGSAGNPAFPVIINGLSITGILANANMGAVNASAKTITDATSYTFNFVNRFQFNGGGYTGAAVGDLIPTVNKPVQRYISFEVAGNSTVRAIGITGSNNTVRRVFVTDGTNLVGTFKYYGTALVDSTVTYTGPATTLYMYCSSSCNMYYLSATNYVAVVTSVNKVLTEKGVSFNGAEILNTKGLSLEVYNVLGKKVAGSLTSIPTTNFQKGVYIVRAAGLNDSLKICI